jgi:hypothetical protein
MQNFSLNFQKIILFQSINYCLDRVKEYHEILFIKFQFWVLKLMNRNIALTGEFTPASPISSEEISQSIETLKKQIDLGFERLESNNKKVFLLKIAYELGYYYYLNNDVNLIQKYFEFCINYFDQLENTNKTLYFEKENLLKLLNIVKFESDPLSEKEAAFDIEMKENLDNKIDLFNLQIKENDFQSLFQKTQIDKTEKSIIEVKLI